jgi:hypothetical protein
MPLSAALDLSWATILTVAGSASADLQVSGSFGAQTGASDPAWRRLRHLPMSFLPRGGLALR